MAAYATVADVQNRMVRTLSAKEQDVCSALLIDAAVLIDAFNANASEDAKNTVSCSMVIRALGDGSTDGVPIGASQGSMSALGYSQSWTMTGGSTGELYMSRTEKRILGVGNQIGSWSPVQELGPDGDGPHYVPPIGPFAINIVGVEEP